MRYASLSQVSPDAARQALRQSIAEGAQTVGYDDWLETFTQGADAAFDENVGIGTLSRYTSLPNSPFTDRLVGREPKRVLSEQEYKESAYYRKEIPYGPDMTEDRAAAKAAWFDKAQLRNQLLSNTGGISGYSARFFGALTGMAMDPINYVPVFGPAARIAAVSRLGVVGGRALISAGEAAAATAAADLAAMPFRNMMGDDVSFEDVVLDIAAGAFIGSVFGGVGGKLEARRIAQQSAALRQIQDTHAALNEAVGSFLSDGRVSLSPDIASRISRTAAAENPAFSPDLFRPRGDADLLSSTVVRLGDEAGSTTNLHEQFPAFRTRAVPGVSRYVSDTVERPFIVQDFEDTLRRFAIDADPDLGARFDAAKARLDAAQAHLDELDRAISSRTEADSTGLIDATAGARMREIERELSANPSQRRRADLEAERDMIRENIGPDAISKAEKDYRIGPEKQIRAARKSLATARQEFSKVSRELDSAAQAHHKIREAMFRPKTDLSSPAPFAPDPVVETASLHVGKSHETMKEMADAFGVDEAGNFPELEEQEMLRTLGRITPEEQAAIDEAAELQRRADRFSDVMLKAVVCELI